MKIIRGAIDVSNNTQEAIESAARELLNAIVERNELHREEVEGIFFTLTKDLTAANPAKTAREFTNASLMCFQEADIEGGMEMCLRAAVFAETDKKIPVYLGKAKLLRPDLIIDGKKIQIAVDGPAGSGKSTISKIIADKLNIIYIDTGAMYRAVTYAALNRELDLQDEVKISELSESLSIDFRDKSIFLDGKNIDKEIRENMVSRNVSKVSAYARVRKRLVDLQRLFSEKKSVIMDGRDIGTVVFPNADFKFYLDASAEIRGKRRFLELREKGEHIPLEKIIEEIKTRDLSDSQRENSPLRKAEDAIIIDTGDMTVEEVVREIIKRVVYV